MNPNQIQTILYAVAIGDALGVPAETQIRDTYHVTQMLSGGIWKQPTGTWSDDTSLTICLAQNLVEDGTLSNLMDKFLDYMQYGKWTPAGVQFDIGRACAKAVRNYAINHYEPTMCGDPAEYACGNGAVMRLAPLAITLIQEQSLTKRYQAY